MRHLKPEEEVRQKLLIEMQEKWGFPKALLSIERNLSSLPHLKGQKVPARRFDIVCFARDLYHRPLLIVECKQGLITPSAADQVIGYNHFAQAFFVAVAGKEHICIAYKKGEYYQFIEGLIPYEEMVSLARSHVCP